METRHAERTGYQSETDATDQVCFHENIRQTRKQQFHLPEKWKLQLFPQGCHSPGQRAGVSPEIFRAIDPQRIQSVTVLKDQLLCQIHDRQEQDRNHSSQTEKRGSGFGHKYPDHPV